MWRYERIFKIITIVKHFVDLIMRWVLLLFLFFLSNYSFSQKNASIYYGVASDTAQNNHILKFINDTLLEVSSVPKHMSKNIKINVRYKKIKDSIIIYKDKIDVSDSSSLLKYNLKQFLNSQILTVEANDLINEQFDIVYIPYTVMRQKYFVTYIIDNEIYRQRYQISNTYGLLDKKYGANRKLKRKIESLNGKIKSYKIYKGLKGYRKYGYNGVFGVIEFIY